MKLLQQAVSLATLAHHGQERKHVALPYIVHPIDVMKGLSDLGIEDEEILAAAVLHDVLEDTQIDEATIREQMGDRVANIVVELTRKGDTPEEKSAYMASFANKSIAAVIIKMMDRFCNVHDYTAYGNEKYAVKYFWKAEQLFDLLDSRRQELILTFGEEFYFAILTTAHTLSESL